MTSTLALRYLAFAALATIANLGTQRIVLSFGEAPNVYVAAIGAGTLVGLVLKYLLDKRWVFYDTRGGAKAHGAQFALYTVMGLATTAIFWSAETAFWLVWRTDFMREVGAILGLSIGYVIKYLLDRRFVFAPLPANLKGL
jgi:putative flippase GtrA